MPNNAYDQLIHKFINEDSLVGSLTDQELASLKSLVDYYSSLSKDETLIGKRIELISTTDPYTNLKPGEVGFITGIDDSATIHVEWQDGSILGLIPGIDNFIIG